MTILLLERVSPSLCGELSRWLLEVQSGVFVGRLSARVRQRLWEKVCQKAGAGAGLIIWSAENEQGFQIETWGETSRTVTDWEGLQLITKPNRQ